MAAGVPWWSVLVSSEPAFDGPQEVPRSLAAGEWQGSGLREGEGWRRAIGFRQSDLVGIFRSLGGVESFTKVCKKSQTITCYFIHDIKCSFGKIYGNTCDMLGWFQKNNLERCEINWARIFHNFSPIKVAICALARCMCCPWKSPVCCRSF